MLKPEVTRHDFDVVSADSDHSTLIVHEPKTKVDLTKEVGNHRFTFDAFFNEEDGNDRIYAATLAPLLDQFDTALEASVPNLVVAKPWLADLLLPLQRSLHGMATSLGNWREKTPPQPHRPATLGPNLGSNLGANLGPGAIARQVESAVSGTGDVVGAISGGLGPAASKRAQRGAKRGTAAPPSTAAAAGASAARLAARGRGRPLAGRQRSRFRTQSAAPGTRAPVLQAALADRPFAWAARAPGRPWPAACLRRRGLCSPAPPHCG
jgi:hypothetical protein